MIDFLHDRLMYTIQSRYNIVITVLILTVFTLILEILYYLKTKSNRGFSIWSLFPFGHSIKTRLTTKQQIFRSVAVAFFLAIFMSFRLLPAYNDISNSQFICIKGQYTRIERMSDGNLFEAGYIYVNNGNEKIRLELPSDWTEAEFPEGTHYGTIWYGKETKVVLCFIAEE